MYPQGVCRIRKPAYAGNGCAIFPVFQTADWGQKIRCPAADDLFRVSLFDPVKQRTQKPVQTQHQKQIRYPLLEGKARGGQEKAGVLC